MNEASGARRRTPRRRAGVAGAGIEGDNDDVSHVVDFIGPFDAQRPLIKIAIADRAHGGSHRLNGTSNASGDPPSQKAAEGETEGARQKR